MVDFEIQFGRRVFPFLQFRVILSLRMFYTKPGFKEKVFFASVCVLVGAAITASAIFVVKNIREIQRFLFIFF